MKAILHLLDEQPGDTFECIGLLVINSFLVIICRHTETIASENARRERANARGGAVVHRCQPQPGALSSARAGVWRRCPQVTHNADYTRCLTGICPLLSAVSVRYDSGMDN